MLVYYSREKCEIEGHCGAMQVPETYPHYMERHDKDSYHSTTVLGKIYDRTLNHPVYKKLVQGDSSSSSDSPAASSRASLLTKSSTAVRNAWQPKAVGPALQLNWPSQLLQVPAAAGWEAFLPAAEEHFAEFERDVLGLMNDWNVYDLGGWLMWPVCSCCCEIHGML